MNEFEIIASTADEPVIEQAPVVDAPATDSTPSTSSTSMSTLPDNYLSNGYYATTEKGQSYLRPEFVADHAQKIAAALSGEMKQSDFSAFQRSLKSAKKRTLPFEARQTAVAEILPKALVLVHCKKAPALLVDFIKANLDAIQNDEDWRGFYRHFEAVNNFLVAGGDF